MKPLAIILLFLCFGLAGGHNNVYAGLAASVNHFSPIGVAQPKQTVTPRHNRSKAIFKAEVSGQETNDFSFAEDNEDDEQFLRKHFVPSRYLARIFYTFISDYYTRVQEKLLAVNTQSPATGCKYLSQGVLRI